MKPKARIRELIEQYDRMPITKEQLLELERGIIRQDGRMFGMMMAGSHPHDCVSNVSGELTATKKHLEDMRRLVMLENEKGEV